MQAYSDPSRESDPHALPDQVYYLHNAWMIYVNGRALPTTWKNRGAALAGIDVQRRRDSADAARLAAQQED